MDAIVSGIIAIVASAMQIVSFFLTNIMSATYLSAHEKGVSRAAIFSGFLLSAYLLMAILRGYIVGFASPKLSLFFNTPTIAIVSLLLLFLIFVPFAAKFEKPKEDAQSDHFFRLIPILSVAFLVACLALWSELIRVPKMEARYCRTALERLSPDLEGKANLALGLARRVLNEDNPWLKSCQELTSTQ